MQDFEVWLDFNLASFRQVMYENNNTFYISFLDISLQKLRIGACRCHSGHSFD